MNDIFQYKILASISIITAVLGSMLEPVQLLAYTVSIVAGCCSIYKSLFEKKKKK